jgi:hypothetical protein
LKRSEAERWDGRDLEERAGAVREIDHLCRGGRARGGRCGIAGEVGLRRGELSGGRHVEERGRFDRERMQSAHVWEISKSSWETRDKTVGINKYKNGFLFATCFDHIFIYLFIS